LATGGTIKSYKDLDVWLMAMSLAESCYRTTRDFPREETYGMTAQIRRASASRGSARCCARWSVRWKTAC